VDEVVQQESHPKAKTFDGQTLDDDRLPLSLEEFVVLFERISGHSIADLSSPLRTPDLIQGRIELTVVAVSRFGLRSGDVARVINKHPSSMTRWLNLGLSLEKDERGSTKLISASFAASATGFMAVVVAWGTYLATIPSGKVPARPVGWIILQLTGIALAVAAVVWSFQSGGSPGAAVLVPAVVAVMMELTFFYLLSQRKTPLGDLKVKVGDRLPPFEVATSDGARFHTDSLAGNGRS